MTTAEGLLEVTVSSKEKNWDGSEPDKGRCTCMYQACVTIGSPTYILAGYLVYGPGKSFEITLQIKSNGIN